MFKILMTSLLLASLLGFGAPVRAEADTKSALRAELAQILDEKLVLKNARQKAEQDLEDALKNGDAAAIEAAQVALATAERQLDMVQERIVAVRQAIHQPEAIESPQEIIADIKVLKSQRNDLLSDLQQARKALRQARKAGDRDAIQAAHAMVVSHRTAYQDAVSQLRQARAERSVAVIAYVPPASGSGASGSSSSSASSEDDGSRSDPEDDADTGTSRTDQGGEQQTADAGKQNDDDGEDSVTETGYAIVPDSNDGADAASGSDDPGTDGAGDEEVAQNDEPANDDASSGEEIAQNDESGSEQATGDEAEVAQNDEPADDDASGSEEFAQNDESGSEDASSDEQVAQNDESGSEDAQSDEQVAQNDESGSEDAADSGDEQVADTDASGDAGSTEEDPAPAPAPEEPTLGYAALTWSVPLTRANGDPLAVGELDGYEIYVTAENSGVSEVIEIGDPMVTDYVVEDLEPDTYYFAISAVDINGLVSELSPVVSKAIN